MCGRSTELGGAGWLAFLGCLETNFYLQLSFFRGLAVLKRSFFYLLCICSLLHRNLSSLRVAVVLALPLICLLSQALAVLSAVVS